MKMNIVLQPFTQSDIIRILEWIQTEDDLICWSGPYFTFPLDVDQLTPYCESGYREPPIRKIYKVVDSDLDKAIGHIELNNIDLRNRAATVSKVLIAEPGYRGKGLCQIITNQLLEIAFNQFGLHRVSLHVFDFNTPAIRCYEACGFTIEGHVRDFRMIRDEFWSSYLMSILDSEWRTKHPE